MHLATGFADEGLDFFAGIKAVLPNADQLLSLGYNAGAEAGTAVMASVIICMARCSK